MFSPVYQLTVSSLTATRIPAAPVPKTTSTMQSYFDGLHRKGGSDLGLGVSFSVFRSLGFIGV